MSAGSAPPDDDDTTNVISWSQFVEQEALGADWQPAELTDATAILAGLRRRGWSAVRVDEASRRSAERLCRALGGLLDVRTPVEKRKLSYYPCFGYRARPGAGDGAATREGFTFLSGAFGKKLPGLHPLVPALLDWCDATAAALADALFPDLDARRPGAFPLVGSSSEPGLRAGLLDFARYAADAPTRVAAHCDPGLFVLSLCSLGPGLQLFDPVSRHWVAVQGSDVAFLWAGSGAAAEHIPLGWHRVVVPPGATRDALWFEVASASQIPWLRERPVWRPLLPTATTVDNDASLPRFTAIVKTLTGKQILLPDLHAGTTVAAVKEMVQDREGIPPAKQRMITKGQEMFSERSLGDYAVQEGDTFQLVLAFVAN